MEKQAAARKRRPSANPSTKAAAAKRQREPVGRTAAKQQPASVKRLPLKQVKGQWEPEYRPKQRKPRPITGPTAAGQQASRNTQKRRPSSMKRTSYQTQRRAQEEKQEVHQSWWGMLFSALYNFCVGGMIIVGMTLFFLLVYSQNYGHSVMGYRFYTIANHSLTTDAMKEHYSAGDLAIVRVQDSNVVEADDMIVYQQEDSRTYHIDRVDEVLSEYQEESGNFVVVNKGEPAQQTLETAAVEGIIHSTLPSLGLAVDFISENTILCILFFVVAIAFFVVLKLFLFGYFDTSKQRR